MFVLRIEPEHHARLPVKEDVSLARTGRKADILSPSHKAGAESQSSAYPAVFAAG